ncbi:hypothetical protein BC940DRAFT_294482 [Gongronella butleri]|nr:hypothetical protein BC940DRAFT_294482 [Gongronella butleri]
MSNSILTPSTSLKTASPGIKLAPLIRQARVVSYERRQGKVWYVIHVDPQQFNNLPTCLKRHSYTIARRYEDCVQFSQRLHDAFPCLTSAASSKFGKLETGYCLPKLKPQGLLNKKASHGQRRAELDRFVQSLFRLPVAITQTLIVLEFFGLQKADTEDQVLRDKQNMVRQQQAIINANQPFAYHYMQQQQQHQQHQQQQQYFQQPLAPHLQHQHHHQLPSMGGVHFRQPSGDSVHTMDDASIYHHPIVMPMATESESFLRWPKLKSFSSSTSLSSFCSQAAHKLPSWSTLSSSCSTSLKKKTSLASSTYTTMSTGSSISACFPYEDPMPSLVSCSSSSTASSESAQQHASTSEPSSPVSPCSSSIVRMIKLKVIYDVDNIVVVQIPRSTSLAALRTRLHDKFSTMLDSGDKALADDFMLLHNEGSRSSSASSLDQQPVSSSVLASSSSITLISKEKHWAMAMKNWNALDKVTLRCIH